MLLTHSEGQNNNISRFQTHSIFTVAIIKPLKLGFKVFNVVWLFCQKTSEVSEEVLRQRNVENCLATAHLLLPWFPHFTKNVQINEIRTKYPPPPFILGMPSVFVCKSGSRKIKTSSKINAEQFLHEKRERKKENLWTENKGSLMRRFLFFSSSHGRQLGSLEPLDRLFFILRSWRQSQTPTLWQSPS